MLTSSSKNKAQESRLARDIEEGIESIKDGVHETAGKVKDDLHELARDAGQKARKYVDSGEESIDDFTGSVANMIQKKPVQSGLIALGIGVVLGMLLQRR